MKNMKRAERRSHNKRLIKKVSKYHTASWREDPKDFAKRHYNNMQFCSCYMCGNQRKTEGDTIQERKFKEGQ